MNFMTPFWPILPFGQAAWLGLAVTCLRFVSKTKIYIHSKGMTLQEMQQISGDLLMISTFNLPTFGVLRCLEF